MNIFARRPLSCPAGALLTVVVVLAIILVSPASHPASAADPAKTREVAEWALSKKGTIRISAGGRNISAKEISQLPTEPFTINQIDVRGSTTNDQDLARFADLVELDKLILSDCKLITDAGLVHLERLTELTELSLYNDKLVGDAGIRRLAALKKLKSLNLVHTQITDEGLRVVAGFPELQILDLESTGVSDAGLPELSSLTNLTKLVLVNTPVTDAAIEQIVKWKKLNQLVLHSTHITDAGAAQLAQLSELKYLTLKGTYVTAPARDALQAKLPQCRIEWEAKGVRSGAPPIPATIVGDGGVKIKSKRVVQPLKIESYCPAPLPKFLAGATIYAASTADQGVDPSYGRLDMTIEKDMGVYLAATWDDDDEADEPPAWMKERIPFYRFMRDGWVLVGHLEFNDPALKTHQLLWKQCRAGEKLPLRTERSHPPLVITVEDPKAQPLDQVPNDATPAKLGDSIAVSKIQRLLRTGRFADLEAAVASVRLNKPRNREGRALLSTFYEGTSALAMTDEEWEFDRKLFEAWIKAYPKSAAAHISLAHYWSMYGWYARGNGFAGTIPEGGSELYAERTRKAREIVKKAYALTEQDAYLCLLDVELAVDFGDSPEEVEKIVERSLKIDPDYTSTLAEVGRYYLPRWHGGQGDLEKWADRAATLTKERWGEALYALVVMKATDYHSVDVFVDFKFSWPRVKQGFADLRKKFPDSILHAEFDIRLAGYSGDRAEVQFAFSQLDRIRGKRGGPDSYVERTWRTWSQDDFMQGDQLQAFDVTRNPLMRLEWTIDGKRWIALDNRSELFTFNAADGKILSRVDTDVGIAKFSSVIPFGKTLVSANWNDNVVSYRLSDSETRVLGKHKEMTGAALSTDGSEYATVGEDLKIKFWNLDTAEDFPDEWDLAPTRISALAYIPNSRTIAVGAWDGTVGFWNRDTKKKSVDLAPRKGGVRFLVVSPDGNLMAVVDNKELTLWRIKEWELFATLPLPTEKISDLVFSRDGRYLAAGTGVRNSKDCPVVIWNTKDGSLRSTLRGHKEMVRTVCFSPDGSRLVSGGDDMTIRVWKVE